MKKEHKNMEKKKLEINVKSFNGEDRVLTGYASTFGFPADHQGDVISKGAFRESVLKIKSQGIPLLDSHVQSGANVLGTVIDAVEDDHGLFIMAKLAETPAVDEIRMKLMQGHIKKMSIGFFVEEHRYQEKDGQDYRIIDKADLIEISIVPVPANDRAVIMSVKQKEQNDGVSTEEVTENASDCLVQATISNEEKKAMNETAELLQQSINQTRRKYNGK